MTALHSHLESSARWHGRRVGTALAAGNLGDANYELSRWRYLRGHYRPIERAEADAVYYRAESEARKGDAKD